MKEIDKKIKAYYEGKSLTKDQLNQIVGRQKQANHKPWKRVLKYAAAFCLVGLCFLLYQYQFSDQEELAEKYAKEVAFNHLKNLESDILTPKIEDLNKKMDKLNFEIHLPTELNKKYALMGGRYCSIDQRLAAQLKLKEKNTDTVVTLYVLDQLQHENYDESFVIDSTAIQIWNENSNLFVLASDTSR